MLSLFGAESQKGPPHAILRGGWYKVTLLLCMHVCRLETQSRAWRGVKWAWTGRTTSDADPHVSPQMEKLSMLRCFHIYKAIRRSHDMYMHMHMCMHMHMHMQHAAHVHVCMHMHMYMYMCV